MRDSLRNQHRAVAGMQHDRIDRSWHMGFVQHHDPVVRPGQGSEQPAQTKRKISCDDTKLDALRDRRPGLAQPILDRVPE